MSVQLTLRAVTISIGERILVPGLNLQVAPGEVVTVMGPSGSGKSTLLAYIGGALDERFVARGRVLIGNLDITHLPPEQRRVGVLFQDDLLFPHLSVGGNLSFGLPAEIKGGQVRRHRIEKALEGADLGGFYDRDPSTLSGGQRARVALLRTLLSEPRALLLDEPFGKLDAALREDIRRFVFDHAVARRLPVLMATHDIADAIAAGGPVISIDGSYLSDPHAAPSSVYRAGKNEHRH